MYYPTSFRMNYIETTAFDTRRGARDCYSTKKSRDRKENEKNKKEEKNRYVRIS